MIGIIPAAGAGQRIQPLGFPKELLPVGESGITPSAPEEPQLPTHVQPAGTVSAKAGFGQDASSTSTRTEIAPKINRWGTSSLFFIS